MLELTSLSNPTVQLSVNIDGQLVVFSAHRPGHAEILDVERARLQFAEAVDDPDAAPDIRPMIQFMDAQIGEVTGVQINGEDVTDWKSIGATLRHRLLGLIEPGEFWRLIGELIQSISLTEPEKND
jgi:hypothetical protein